MLSTYIRKHFGKRSTGAWISGACWKQSVVTSLAKCAIAYTFLPERVFAEAGVEPAALGQPVYTENQGALITVFPLLYLGAPAASSENKEPLSVGRLFALIKERGQNGVYTIFPDWFSGNGADTQASICAFLEESLSPGNEVNWTIPARFREAQSGNGKQSIKRIYFSGGKEKNFLTECPEANIIYAKMVFTSDLVRQLRGDRQRKYAAMREVYKAQCCNLYGSRARHTITDPALRHAAYRALLSAERITREEKKTVNTLYRFDFDFDGGEEDIFRGNALRVYAHRKGGHIFGIDYLPVCWNYIDSFGRRSFIETLYSGDIAPAVKTGSSEAVRAALDAIDLGRVRRCGEEWWEEVDSDRAKQRLTLALGPQARPPEADRPPLPGARGAPAALRLEKTYRLMKEKDTFVVSYTISNRGTEDERLLFCPELHFAFAGDDEGCLRVFATKGDERAQVAAHGCHSTDIDGYQFQDLSNETVIRFLSSKPFDALLEANTTAGRYQSTRLTALVPLALKAGAKVSREFRLTISS
jgi:hypothetical protein